MKDSALIKRGKNRRLSNILQIFINSLSLSLADANTKRETGKVAQLNNIAAAKVSHCLITSAQVVFRNK